MRRFLLFVLLTSCAGAAGVPRNQCFPLETLPPQLREVAEQMLLEALDREALYTLIGGLKAMSSAILTEERQFQLDTAKPQIREFEEFQQIAETWRCGEELWAGISALRHVVPKDRDTPVGIDVLGRKQGVRTVYGNVLNLPAVRRVIEAHAPLFGYHGLTRRTAPAEMLARIGMLDEIDFNLAFGYLYGYPSHAVEFYSRLLDRARKGQPLKPGEAVNINVPTYSPVMVRGETGSQFRYRIAPDHQEDDEDRRLRITAAKTLEAYRARRPKYIGEGKPGVLALIRDWYDDGKGLCAPSNAKVE